MLKNDTKKIQSDLAGYCRNGQPVQIPGTKDGRLHNYRRLVFGVIKNTMDQAYPIARQHLGDERWDMLIEEFFAAHPCQHPQVWCMPRELIDYVQLSGFDKNFEMPHLIDLLRMEWLEIEVHAMTDVKVGISAPIDDLMHDALAFNPYFRLERFTYPVHKIHERNPADFPGGYFLLIFREMSGKQRVQFVSLQPFYAVLLDTLIQNPGISANETLDALNHEQQVTINISDLEKVKELINHLVEKKFIVGKRSI